MILKIKVHITHIYAYCAYTRARARMYSCHGGNMKEKQIEQKLVRMAAAAGGVALKFVSPGCDGVPDRLVLFPGGKAGFVELKAPGKKPRPLQLRRISQLRRLGFAVFVVDGVEQISEVLGKIGDKNGIQTT